MYKAFQPVYNTVAIQLKHIQFHQVRLVSRKFCIKSVVF